MTGPSIDQLRETIEQYVDQARSGAETEDGQGRPRPAGEPRDATEDPAPSP